MLQQAITNMLKTNEESRKSQQGSIKPQAKK